MPRVFRQVDEGEQVETRKVIDDFFWHYENQRFDGPLPEGWREVEQWQCNWDGGPGLRRIARVCDHPAPFDAAFEAAATTMTRAEQLALELVERLRPWGAEEPRVLVWHLATIANVGQARAVMHDVATILRHLRIDRIEVVPQELEDPYCAFGPDGPPPIPAALVGRRVAELGDPLALTEEIRALGVYVSIEGDEIRLALARGEP